jgi:hypothetical protein
MSSVTDIWTNDGYHYEVLKTDSGTYIPARHHFLSWITGPFPLGIFHSHDGALAAIERYRGSKVEREKLRYDFS